MTDALHVPEKVLAAYRMLKKAAEMGDECPSNLFLAGACGWNSPGGPSAAVALLESIGMIEVTRYNRARVIHIAEIGKSTKPVRGPSIRYLPRRRRAIDLWMTDELLDCFADELSEHGSFRKAGRNLNLSEGQTRKVVDRIRSDLGAQAA